MDKPGERLNMLQRNNQQLSAELALVREENQRLDSNLTDMRNKHLEYADTLAAVDRIWQQMNKDMLYVSRRIRGFPLEPEIKPEEPNFQHADPLLERLIRSEHTKAEAVQKRLEEMEDDATEVEKQLAKRTTGTLETFAALVELHDQELAKYRTAVEKLDQGQDAGLSEDVLKLQQETKNLRQEVDAQKAISRTAEAQLQQLTDMLHKDETTIQNLNNELADKREELNVANRKLLTLKASEGAIGLTPQNSLTTPLAKRTSTSPTPIVDSDTSDALRIAQKEAKTERERADTLAKQCRDAQAKMQDESFIHQTGAYQVLQRQLQAQVAELEKAKKIMEVLQRECEGYKHSTQGLMQQAEDGRHHRRMAHLAEERMKEMENQLSNARSAQETAELELEKLKERMGDSKTVQELKSMIDVLEKEAQTNRGNASKRQSLLAEIEAAKKDMRSVVANLEAKEAEVKELSQKMSTWDADIASLKSREKELQRAADDLRVFVEVLQSFCEDPRDLAEVRASEASLKNELSSLENKLKGHELQVALEKARSSEEHLQVHVKVLQQQRTSLELETEDLKRQCADLQKQVATLTGDIDAYTTEMEAIGTAYEEMQGTNSRLLREMTQKDEKNNHLLLEKIQAQQTALRVSEQKATAEAARKLAEEQAAALQERLTVLETRLQENMHELGQVRERSTVLAQQGERLSAELRERESLLQQKDSQLQTLQSAADQRKQALDDDAEKLHREKSRRHRLEEENKALHGKVEKLSNDASSVVNDELEGMRLMIRCRVCHVRTKDTVITKCWHTFCGDCIKRNLDARNRKCPACGHLFGAQDVKQIYL